MRLFLCDDNHGYRTLARAALAREGFEILGEADDGAGAIERAPALAPDALLLDLNMPSVDGIQALPALRAALPATTIVVLTSGQALDERERAMQAGAHAFIAKPASIFTLAGELRAALAAHQEA
jgi:DNA-binding NarL/FixJ family response regulator